jgi:hypothetical protein
VFTGFAGVLLALAGTLVVVVPGLTEPGAGIAPEFPVAAGVEEGGRVVSGVGSGGSGFDKMLATISFIPASDLS